ncbi:uncharacterized protein [Drosophila tropicalis]|uniref:uncharacterized protein n=1 Tax=Drosophila tropicalis TaxID=46794 RepID=UPI0035AC1AF3
MADIVKRRLRERILIWMDAPDSKDLLQTLVKQAHIKKYRKLLVFNVATGFGYSVLGHPVQRFTTIPNITTWTKSIFFDKVDFKGKPIFFSGYLMAESFLQHSPGCGNLVLERLNRKLILEFSRKYNITLMFDAQELDGNAQTMNSISKMQKVKKIDTTNGHFSQPFVQSSIFIIVPCGKDITISDLYKMLAIKSWSIYILASYVAVSFMEILILYVSNRRSKRLTFAMCFNVFTNFRFLRAILGQSFPFGRRASFSLKQLMIAISVFGMIFSSFFGSKLSTLLTLYPKTEHIKNFQELRDENITVVFDVFTAVYIRNNIDAEFFQKTVPNSWIVTPKERIDMIYALNTSYAYQIYTEPWLNLKDINQKHHIFCTTPELRIIENAALFSNFDRSPRGLLRNYISWTMSVGLFKYWLDTSLEKEKASIRYIPTEHVLPLDLQSLKWAWYLLAIGYILSMCVFFVEVCLERRQRRVMTLT